MHSKKTNSKNDSLRLDHVNGWKKSGMSKAEYGRKHGIHPVVLSRWIRKFSNSHEAIPFVMVDADTKLMSIYGWLEIHLTSGIMIRLEDRMPIAAIREIVAGIKEL